MQSLLWVCSATDVVCVSAAGSDYLKVVRGMAAVAAIHGLASCSVESVKLCAEEGQLYLPVPLILGASASSETEWGLHCRTHADGKQVLAGLLESDVQCPG